MQGNLEIIRDMMGARADEAKTEFRLIDEQMHRVNEIVTRLPAFAKPQEYAGFTDQYDPAVVVTDTLPLAVKHLLNKTTISVETDYHASRLISMNRTELQQVLVNLLVNAIHATSGGGRLTISNLRSERGKAPWRRDRCDGHRWRHDAGRGAADLRSILYHQEAEEPG